MHRKLRIPILLVLLVFAGAVAVPGAAQSADYEQVVDLTFPTDSKATFGDDYHSGRSGGRRHRATDLMGQKMWPIYAAVGGTVTFIPGLDGEPEPSYGYMVRITGDDGRTYSYVHLNNDTPGTDDDAGGPGYAYAPGLARGSRVERGQLIGYMGDSGNAKGITPHLHFEISDPAVRDPYGGNRINPVFSLRSAVQRRDYATGASGAPNVDRVQGRYRVETAVALSEKAFASADTVVLTSAASYPDAIVAGPLAAALDAPVLTTFGSELEGPVAAEINRLGAERLLVVGPPERVPHSIPQAVYAQTSIAEGRRITGASDAETAAAVAAEVRQRTGSSDVLVALGSHPREGRAWADALTAGYHGALSGRPVLLVDHDRVPQATLDALTGVSTATIVGGVGAVSEVSEDAIAAAVPLVERLSGRDRFETSAVVADDLLKRGLADASRVWVATGHDYADALAAAGALAVAGELLVLADGDNTNGDNRLEPWYAALAGQIDRGRAIGGTAAISDAALARLAQRIR